MEPHVLWNREEKQLMCRDGDVEKILRALPCRVAALPVKYETVLTKGNCTILTLGSHEHPRTQRLSMQRTLSGVAGLHRHLVKAHNSPVRCSTMPILESGLVHATAESADKAFLLASAPRDS
jgi:hypothetical protein